LALLGRGIKAIVPDFSLFVYQKDNQKEKKFKERKSPGGIFWQEREVIISPTSLRTP
jgi:hypothetical protein